MKTRSLVVAALLGVTSAADHCEVDMIVYLTKDCSGDKSATSHLSNTYGDVVDECVKGTDGGSTKMKVCSTTGVEVDAFST